MTRKPVRLKVNCASCRGAFGLSQEHYKKLIKQAQLSLKCPHCAHRFVYKTMTAATARHAAEPDPPRPVAVKDNPPSVPSALPAPAEAPAAEFPPPPFAPLGMGATPAAPAMAAPPPFAPLGGVATDFAPPAPRAAATPDAGKKLSLNERFKRLPPWQQWLVIGVVVVFLAVVIFAMPTGGSGGGKEPADSSSLPTPHSPLPTRTQP